MYVVPPTVNQIADPSAKYYVTLRCAIDKDVSFITTANPSSTIKLIETGQQHAEQLIRDVADGTLTPPQPVNEPITDGLKLKPNRALAKKLENGIAQDGELLPRHFWNIAFLANWTGGTLKLYLPRLRRLFDGAPIRDIGLLASEGRMSIPLSDETPAGVAEITSNFMEFIPVEDADSEKPTIRRAHEVQMDQEYFLVITNYAGLWRYNLDARVKVIDRLGDTPVFEFLSRGLHTANITGEKITEHHVVDAMAIAARRTAIKTDRFVLQGRFAKTPYYELRLESPPDDAAKLARAMDDALAELNIEYASKRKSGRLGPIKPAVLPQGALEKAEAEKIARRGGRSEQYKHQYLHTDVIEDDQSA
jgi:hypothetical protein